MEQKVKQQRDITDEVANGTALYRGTNLPMKKCADFAGCSVQAIYYQLKNTGYETRRKTNINCKETNKQKIESRIKELNKNSSMIEDLQAKSTKTKAPRAKTPRKSELSNILPSKKSSAKKSPHKKMSPQKSTFSAQFEVPMRELTTQEKKNNIEAEKIMADMKKKNFRDN